MNEKTIERIKSLVAVYQHRLAMGKSLPKLNQCIDGDGRNDYPQMIALLRVQPQLAPSATFECGRLKFNAINEQHERDTKNGDVLAVAVTLFNAAPADFVAISYALLPSEEQRSYLTQLLTKDPEPSIH